MGCIVLKILALNESEITPEIDGQIKEGLCRSFPWYGAVFSVTRSWHGVFPVISIVGLSDDESRVIAHSGIIQRKIFVNGKIGLSIFGIQNVFIHPDFRGRGLLRPLMDQIIRVAVRGEYDCGLLFCVPELEKVYSAHKWERIPETKIALVNEKGEEGLVPEINIAMFYPLKISDFPVGVINLQGNDW